MISFNRNNLETSLGHIVQFTEQSMSRAVFGQAISSKKVESGAAKAKIADLRFYGLLSPVKEKQRSFTDICIALKTPVAPKKEKEAKARAFLFPEEFRKVYDKYKGLKIKIEGNILEEIADLLNRDLVYTKTCMTVFKESGIFAGVLIEQQDGSVEFKDVASLIPEDDEIQKDTDTPKKVDEVTSPKPDVTKKSDRGEILSIREPTSDVSVRTSFPLSVSLNIDGSTSAEMAETVLNFLREAGLGKEKTHRIEFLVTQPPRVKELRTEVIQLLQAARKEIRIVTPYIDNEILHILLPKAEQNIRVEVITREKSQFSGKEAKEAFDHLQTAKGITHYSYNLLHSRILVIDELMVLVSSADMSHDSLEGQFNAGILTDYPSTVKKCSSFIDSLIKEVKKKEKNNPQSN